MANDKKILKYIEESINRHLRNDIKDDQQGNDPRCVNCPYVNCVGEIYQIIKKYRSEQTEK